MIANESTVPQNLNKINMSSASMDNRTIMRKPITVKSNKLEKNETS